MVSINRLGRLLLPIFFASLLNPAQPAFGDKRAKLRDDAFKQYAAGNYSAACPILRELIADDSTAYCWMDYALLAEIYLREGSLDSAGWIITLGVERTNSSSDRRLRARNREVWDNLRRQLKHHSESLILPPYRPLDDFADSVIDSIGADSALSSSEELDLAAMFGAPDAPIIELPEEAKRTSPDEAADSINITHRKRPQPKIIGGVSALNEYIEANRIFPDSACAAGINMGAAVVKVTVDTSGNPIDLDIVRVQPQGMGFEQLALIVFREMQYQPAETDSGRVEGTLQQPVLFKSPPPQTDDGERKTENREP